MKRTVLAVAVLLVKLITLAVVAPHALVAGLFSGILAATLAALAALALGDLQPVGRGPAVPGLMAPVFPAWVAPRLRDVYADKELQERAITASQLDWLLVRPAALVDSAPGRSWRRIDGKGHLYEAVCVDEVARFIVERLSVPQLGRVAISLGSEVPDPRRRSPAPNL
jgi:hypothetical protein